MPIACPPQWKRLFLCPTTFGYISSVGFDCVGLMLTVICLQCVTWISDLAVLNPIYSDTTQLNWTSSWVELYRYKWGFSVCSLLSLVCGIRKGDASKIRTTSRKRPWVITYSTFRMPCDIQSMVSSSSSRWSCIKLPVNRVTGHLCSRCSTVCGCCPQWLQVGLFTTIFPEKGLEALLGKCNLFIIFH